MNSTRGNCHYMVMTVQMKYTIHTVTTVKVRCCYGKVMKGSLFLPMQSESRDQLIFISVIFIVLALNHGGSTEPARAFKLPIHHSVQ